MNTIALMNFLYDYFDSAIFSIVHHNTSCMLAKPNSQGAQLLLPARTLNEDWRPDG